MGGIPSEENKKFIKTAIKTGSNVVIVVVCRSDQDPTDWTNFLSDNFRNIKRFVYITNWNFDCDLIGQAKSEAIGLFIKIKQILKD